MLKSLEISLSAVCQLAVSSSKISEEESSVSLVFIMLTVSRDIDIGPPRTNNNTVLDFSCSVVVLAVYCGY